MHLSFAFTVSMVAMTTVSAGIYPVKTGGKGAGHSKGGSEGSKQTQDDRFHLQSPDGQYVFGHTSGNQGRAEMRSEDGTVTGYYSYTDGNGHVVYVNYVADKNGYRVVSNTGVPSASVTIEGNAERGGSRVQGDFQKVFSDFTKRIEDKVVQRAGQMAVDPVADGQHQVPTDPIKETKPSKHDERNPFPSWDQVKISTTQKPKPYDINEGQQQQVVSDPNLDDAIITTQKSNIKTNDNDNKGYIDNNEQITITTTETATKRIPLVPNQPLEITTEITDSRIGQESTVVNDKENDSPVTRPIPIIINDIQTTVSYDAPGQNSESSNTSQRDFQTTISSVTQFEETSTASFSESATERSQITENDVPTTIRSDQMDNELIVNVPTTEDSSRRTDFQVTTTGATLDVDYATTGTASGDGAVTIGTSAAYGPGATTYQSEIGDRVGGDADTTAEPRYATEAANDDRPEFRTLEPSDVIGTTANPADPAEAQVQEIIWPVIPQEPVPQVLVPIDPYPDSSQTKNSGIKTGPMNMRLARNNESEDAEESIVNAVETVMNTTPTITHVKNDNNATTFDFPKFFVMG